MRRVAQSLKKLNRYPFYLNKQVRCTVSDVRALARQVKGLRLVVIDYLGLLKPEGRQNSRYEEITAISGDLKALARSLGVPVLCLAQLNRASEQRSDKKPTLADLRDSGAIEQDLSGAWRGRWGLYPQPVDQQAGGFVAQFRRRCNVIQHSSILPQPRLFVRFGGNGGNNRLYLCPIHTVMSPLVGFR